MALRWDPRTMATGVEEIDLQHQELIKYLNQFFSLMKEGRANSGLEEFMDFLSTYAKYHFQHEEECMDRHRCPAATANKKAHASFIRIFDTYRERLKTQGPSTSLVIEIQRQVSDWIRNHICRTDARLRECVKAEAG